MFRNLHSTYLNYYLVTLCSLYKQGQSRRKDEQKGRREQEDVTANSEHGHKHRRDSVSSRTSADTNQNNQRSESKERKAAKEGFGAIRECKFLGLSSLPDL
jgi:hypothetical protein